MKIFHFCLIQRGAFVSEPAILVKRTNSGSQIWTMEKLENKLIDMREMYQEHKERILNGLVSYSMQMVSFFHFACNSYCCEYLLTYIHMLTVLFN